MIKSILYAPPMSCYLLPDKILNQFTKLNRKYWWSHDTRKTNIHWIKKSGCIEVKRKEDLTSAI